MNSPISSFFRHGLWWKFPVAAWMVAVLIVFIYASFFTVQVPTAVYVKNASERTVILNSARIVTDSPFDIQINLPRKIAPNQEIKMTPRFWHEFGELSAILSMNFGPEVCEMDIHISSNEPKHNVFKFVYTDNNVNCKEEK